MNGTGEEQYMKMTKWERCEVLRYKKPALASMSFNDITEGLDAIEELCGDVHWWIDNEQDFLINALDDSEEEAFNFRMAFSDIENDCYRLREALQESVRDLYYFSDYEEAYKDAEKAFNDTTVALVGNRFNLVGYDDYEYDYFDLVGYDSELAEREAGKRLMRLTKKEMLSAIGMNMGILIAYLDLSYRFDRLKATMEILQDKNHSLLDTIRSIEKAYDEWEKNQTAIGKTEAEKRFDSLLENLPEQVWIV